MKTVLITGGAGYVGTLLTKQLLNRNYKIIVYDTFWFGDFIEDHPNLKKIKGDIRDIKKLSDIKDRINSVIHLACISNDNTFELNPKLSEEINYNAFSPLVNFFKTRGIERFINASSSSVYGFSDNPNVTEEHELLPLTSYNKFKGLCEPILFENNSRDFICTNVRPATICGCSPRMRFDLSVNILTNLATRTKEITVFGGKQMRPNLHINDMCNFYEFLLEADPILIGNKTFNISDENISIENLAIKIKGIFKKKYNLDVSINKVESEDDKRSYHLNSDKIKKELNFNLKYSVDDAINDIYSLLQSRRFDDSLVNNIYYNIKMLKKLKIT
jgi:nucleoside-diphosphate-sugar epimerase